MQFKNKVAIRENLLPACSLIVTKITFRHLKIIYKKRFNNIYFIRRQYSCYEYNLLFNVQLVVFYKFINMLLMLFFSGMFHCILFQVKCSDKQLVAPFTDGILLKISLGTSVGILYGFSVRILVGIFENYLVVCKILSRKVEEQQNYNLFVISKRLNHQFTNLKCCKMSFTAFKRKARLEIFARVINKKGI